MSRFGKKDNAHKILWIFEHFGSKPGEVLRVKNIVAVGNLQRWRMSDLQEGLDYALENHWVEQPRIGSFKLTEIGDQELSTH
jgi:hypothetical protein